ncbi:MAG: serine/threonine protein kinase [Lentisphaerales bacterium]|nr:MAG: serine/threonine protein kinase [Lentisphaerales bacterium]
MTEKNAKRKSRSQCITVQSASSSGRVTGFRPGSVITTTTRYELKRQIATGGMGSIYEAEQHGAVGFVKTVAIKLLLPEISEDEEFVSMFIGEAKLVAGLVHQNIVQMYQLGRSDDGYFIAMEYIDGIDLEQFMARHQELDRTVPVELVSYIASRICRGLEYAHSKTDENGERLDIVHRDVSPRNIMVTNEGEVKLTDFGVAKARRIVADKLNDCMMVGKIPYMSPEQATYKDTDKKSDIFSLGVVFYELLTGERIFERDSESDAIDGIVNGEIPPVEGFRQGVPQELVDILMRCLARSPAERFRSAGEVGYELERHMYSKGYGPTIVTLAKYTAEIFPEKRFYEAASRGDDLNSSILRK